MSRKTARRSGGTGSDAFVWLATALGLAAMTYTVPTQAQRPSVREPVQRSGPAPVELERDLRAPRMHLTNPRIEAALSPRQTAALEAQGRKLSRQLLGSLRPGAVRARRDQQVRQIMLEGMQGTVRITSSRDAATLVLQTMFAALDAMQGDLRALADRLQSKREIIVGIREEISLLRDELSDWPPGETRELTYRSFTLRRDGSVAVAQKTQTLTREQAERLLRRMESQVATLSDASEAHQLALQDAMNNQAQLMQTMSNIMKAMHDEAKSIIQNLR